MVEWECILECNYRCFYCGNGRNDMLHKPIRYETDKVRTFKFLDKIYKEFPDEELFVFGGEPFIHPFIDEIIGHMNEIGMKFVIQTNFSFIDRIKQMLDVHEFTVQVSLHPTEINDKMQILNGIEELQNIIRRIDIMFVGQTSLDLFKDVLPRLTNKRVLHTTPVGDFNLKGVCNEHLYRFNEMKRAVYGKVYQFEEGDRSFDWEEQMKGGSIYKGRPCIYKDRYVLFDPSLKRYMCNYRQNNEVCPNDQCFLM